MQIDIKKEQRKRLQQQFKEVLKVRFDLENKKKKKTRNQIADRKSRFSLCYPSCCLGA